MFGMGTGGSLRLLSPETKQSLDSFAAAYSLLGFSFKSAPSKPHRLETSLPLHFRLTKTSVPLLSVSPKLTNPSGKSICFCFGFQFPQSLSFRSSAHLSVLLQASLLPAAYSLLPFPRSSPRPISIIKLHTLPHFHR